MEIGLRTGRELGPAFPVEQLRENRLENVLGVLAAFYTLYATRKTIA